MNKRNIIVLGGGFLVALLVALIMQSMIGNNKPADVAVATNNTVRVLIASKNLNVGDTLDQSSMEWKKWPEDGVFEGAVIESNLDLDEGEQALSGRLIRNVVKGEPLTKSALIDSEKGNFVAASLGAGKRAMAIKVKAETSVGGFVSPNDHVDVILTYDLRIPSDPTVTNASIGIINKKASQTVLENIRVMGVDQKAKEVDGASIYKTITLEVTPKEAEVLALADSMGRISLALRKLGDDKMILDQNAADTDTLSTATTDTRLSTVMQELLGNTNSSGARPSVVRVYNGANVSELVVRPSNAQ